MDLEQRFEKLKCVMVNNLETLHDMLMDQMDESEEYYNSFEGARRKWKAQRS